MTADGLSPSSIISLVASATGVRTIDIRSDQRTKAVTLARHVAMWLARRETPLSYPMIGYAFGRRITPRSYMRCGGSTG